MLRRGEPGAKPGGGGANIASNGNGSHILYLRDLLCGEATEIAHLEDAGLARVHFFKRVESVVNLDDAGVGAVGDVHGVIERKGALFSAALLGVYFTNEVNQDLAHEAGGNVVEVGTVDPIGLILADETKEGFVDQFGGADFGAAFAGKAGAGEDTKFGIDEGSEFAEDGFVAGPPLAQKLRDLAGSRLWFHQLEHIEFREVWGEQGAQLCEEHPAVRNPPGAGGLRVVPWNRGRRYRLMR